MKRYNKKNVPSVFNFKVSPKHLNEDDLDLLYTCERERPNAFIVYYELGSVQSVMYSQSEVLEYLNDRSWLIEGIDFEVEEEE